MRRTLAAPVAVAKVAVVAVAVLGATVLAACGGGETTEIAVDEGDGGSMPTAPPPSTVLGNPALTGDVDLDALIARLEALTSETDLCTLLTGRAMADVTGADINLAALAADPSGFTRLFAALEGVFGHMGSIAPPELVPPLAEMQQVWAGLAALDLRSATAEQQAQALLGSVAAQGANEQLGDWVLANCT